MSSRTDPDRIVVEHKDRGALFRFAKSVIQMSFTVLATPRLGLEPEAFFPVANDDQTTLAITFAESSNQRTQALDGMWSGDGTENKFIRIDSESFANSSSFCCRSNCTHVNSIVVDLHAREALAREMRSQVVRDREKIVGQMREYLIG